VLLPGRGRRLREPAEHEVGRLIDALAPAVRPLADRPLACFGHSLGALLAFEVVRAWRSADGFQPAHLFVSGSHAPQAPRSRPSLSGLPDAEFLSALREIGGTPPQVLAHPELVALILPALRGDFALAETYRYRPGAPLATPLTAFGGEDDHRAAPLALEAWREQTSQSFEVRLFPGGHFYLEAQAPAVAANMARKLHAIEPVWPTAPAAG
jgi:medium-chain acyl-[acyl-carrier-protein] hydrolase